MNGKNTKHRTYLDTADGMAKYANLHGAFLTKDYSNGMSLGKSVGVS